VNIALFPEHPDKVELCLFDAQGRREIKRVSLSEHTDQVWHGYLPDARPRLLYGYRVGGPCDPARGHPLQCGKLLLDPYAKSIVGPFRWSDAHFGYRLSSKRADLAFDRSDNARGMLKCQEIDPAFTWGENRRLNSRWQDTIIYELHVKGFTMKDPEVPPQYRGIYADIQPSLTR
jgi:isoamylase